MLPGLASHHPALDLRLLHAPQQQPDVVARPALVQQLAEHLHARHDRLLGRPEAHQLQLLADLHLAPVHPARGDRAAARDREHVLHRMLKGLSISASAPG